MRRGPDRAARAAVEALERRALLSVSLLRDVDPSTADAIALDRQPFVSGNLLYFAADDGVRGLELWRSDGTEAGTTLVRDVNTTPLSSNPSWLTRVGDQVFFSATTRTGTGGSRGPKVTGLWKTDGTAAGTVPVKTDGLTIKPPDQYTLPRDRPTFAEVGGKLFFAAVRGDWEKCRYRMTL